METQSTDASPLEAARCELSKGENLAAFDIARPALKADPGNDDLAHVAVLALARSGAMDLAAELFRNSGLDKIANEEILGLRARLAKDIALTAADPSSSPALAISIAAYQQGYDLNEGYYPAINVAFLQLLAGDEAARRDWADRALKAAGDEQSYYAEATRAEALLLLDRVGDAEASLGRAASLADATVGAKSTTWKQLNLVCARMGIDTSILTPLKPGPVVHYCGHIIAAPGQKGRFPADQEAEVAVALKAFFRESGCSRAIGSLAAGADILAAEAALEAGADLVAVLPFNASEFKHVSVETAGGDWLQRFDACMKAAREVLFVTPDAYLGDDALFGYASQFALGLVQQRAGWLQTEPHQIAVWDGEDGPNAAAGTGYDLLAARRAGFGQTVISVRSTREAPAAGPDDGADRDTSLDRLPRAIIFGDLKGFSALNDAQMPSYVEDVLGGLARALDSFRERLLFRNTWGDGIYLVFDDLEAAAGCAFALQEAVKQVLIDNPTLPPTLGLRMGMHYGPVFQMEDPVLRRTNFFGSHVSYAARTEPKTPEGEIYVTAQTAAALALECHDDYRCEYVGRIPLAKNYGEFPMYHLRRI